MIGQFLCEVDLYCIDNVRVCDKQFDCHDKSDEKYCDENIIMFTCENGEKVHTNHVCDFQSDCSDSSDEFYCGKY